MAISAFGDDLKGVCEEVEKAILGRGSAENHVFKAAQGHDKTLRGVGRARGARPKKKMGAGTDLTVPPPPSPGLPPPRGGC